MMQRVTLLEKTVRSQAQEIKCKVITQLLRTNSNTPFKRAEITLDFFCRKDQRISVLEEKLKPLSQSGNSDRRKFDTSRFNGGIWTESFLCGFREDTRSESSKKVPTTAEPSVGNGGQLI